MRNKENAHTIYLAGVVSGIGSLHEEASGVYDTDVGYANGNTEDPTYEQVCNENTGHAETVKDCV